MSDRRKIIAGAIGLVAATFLLTCGGIFYWLHTITGDATGALKLLEVMQIIKSDYVEATGVEKLMDGAVKGAVNSLGDPHSIYMDAKMYKEFMIETEGSFGGVGIVLGVRDKVLTVISPIEGTPSEQAGIKGGDQITKIDGLDTKDMALDEAVNKIRGTIGTQVTLTITRGQEVKDYSLVRSNIQIKSVAGKMLPDSIGYIRISSFNETTGSDFIHKYRELEQAGMKGLILDLRDNPGGLLQECIKVANLLVPKGPIVSVVSRTGEKETMQSSLEEVPYPLVVLVNGGSASASEIVAGAVQDTQAGVLVGTKTYGKGSVQTIKYLYDGTAIKLTIAKYLTPADRSINGIGIEPNVVVDLPADAKKDIQFDKAIEIVKSKLQ
ncbi:MAG: carboxyl-terminal protease [Firmicutes bacterium]|nr:carboxyl-terminal protease [Bacillota bacterium]